MYVVICVHEHMCAGVCGSQRSILGVFFDCSPHYLLRQNYLLAQEPVWLDWVTGESQGPSCLRLPISLKVGMCSHAQRDVDAGSKLRPPCLCYKHASDQAASLVPTVLPCDIQLCYVHSFIHSHSPECVNSSSCKVSALTAPPNPFSLP